MPLSTYQVVQAQPADSFLETIGVNTHLHYTNTIYNEFDQIIQPRLAELQVRYIRDGAYTYDGIQEDTFYYQRLRELAGQGIQFNLITQALDTTFGDPTRYDLLDEVYAWTNQAVVAFEGVNEPNAQGIGTWVADTRRGQQQLFQAVNAHGLIRDIPVLGPSPTSSQARDRLGNLSAWMDYGNIHNYWGGRPPETQGWGANGYGSLAWNLAETAKNSGTDPVISTETGWRNDSVPGQNQPGIPQGLVARYLPRLFLTHFNAGIDRTYLYELVDQGNEEFGLLNSDGSPKPAFRALKNLISLFEDEKQPFTPESLRFGIVGETQNLHQTLLQKRNGNFYLVLWATPPDLASEHQSTTLLPPQKITVSFADTLNRQATLYRFQDNGYLSSTQVTLADNTLNLVVRDNVTVIELMPQVSSQAIGPQLPTASTTALVIEGTPQADRLDGTAVRNVLKGYGGHDLLLGQAGDDTLLAGSDADIANGHSGDDRIYGEAGNDQLTGGSGNDHLYGGPGNDLLTGSSLLLDQRLTGEHDVLVGGPGADVFVLGDARGFFYGDHRPDQLGTEDLALITDFNPAAGDQIQLSDTTQYRLESGYRISHPGLGTLTGQAIWVDVDEHQGYQDELIAIATSPTSLQLTSSAFRFLGSRSTQL